MVVINGGVISLSIPLPFGQRIIKRNLFMDATIQIPSEMYEARGVNKDKTKYSLLDNDGVSRCTNPLIDFCEFKNPICPLEVHLG
jgi:hypothetical protein